MVRPVLIILTLLLCQGTLRAQWSTRISGQYTTVRYDDYNRFADAWNASHDASLYPRLGNMNTAQGYHVEITRRIGRFHAGLGAGYFNAGTVDYRTGPTSSKYDPERELKHAVSAVPVRLVGRYDALRAGRAAVYAGAAITYWMTTITFEQRETGYLTYSDLYDITRSAQAELGAERFGLDGFLGVEVSLSGRLSLDLRISGRRADIGGFAGSQDWSEESVGPVWTVTRSGTRGAYLIYDGETGGTVSYGPRESGPWSREERNGRVNLSGIGIEFGVRIVLFK